MAEYARKTTTQIKKKRSKMTTFTHNRVKNSNIQCKLSSRHNKKDLYSSQEIIVECCNFGIDYNRIVNAGDTAKVHPKPD